MRTSTIADLKVEIVGEEHGPSAPLVVLLHGYDGFAGDLSPFATSFGLPLRYVFPEAFIRPDGTPRGGNAWWPIDDEGRSEAIARGETRDLSDIYPPGLARARARLTAFLDELEGVFGPVPPVLGGFSQGAMLSCDLVLRSNRRFAGLVLLAGARICKDDWAPLYASRTGLPAFVSHGRRDPDLSFAAAERLRDDLSQGGLDVEWVPFDGGHEVPLLALRGLKRFLAAHARAPARADH